MTRILYDLDGVILDERSGNYTIPRGVPCIEVDIPDGKNPIGVDVTSSPHKVIYEDIPHDPLLDRVRELEDRCTTLQQYNATLEDIAYTAMEAAVEVYEMVQPFLPK